MMRSTPILMVVTDPSVPNLDDRLADAISGGATLIQYRNKAATTEQRVKWARAFKKRHPGSLLVINDDLQAVIQCDADGLHMSSGFAAGGPNDLPLGPGRMLGRSVHLGDIKRESGRERGVDYVTLGTIFPSETHPDRPVAGLEGLQVALGEIGMRLGPVPVVAIGGVNRDNAADCIRAGARGVAVIRGILMAADPGQAAADILKSMREAI
jgi:thiamine-phosphate diphosphorylase